MNDAGMDNSVRSAPARPAGAGRPTALIGLTLLLIAALTVRHLPPGQCFDDPGDLQAASQFAGIAHPPGYACYAAVGWLLIQVSPVNPALTITIACWASALLALGWTAQLLIRLGCSAGVACGATLILAAHPVFRESVVVPEVYAPTLALLCGALLCWSAYARAGQLRWLALGGACLGFAVGNRTPAALLLPGFVIPLFFARPAQAPRRALRAVMTSLATMAIFFILSVGYLWLRDHPSNRYHHAAAAAPLAQPLRYDALAKRERLFEALLGGRAWSGGSDIAGRLDQRLARLGQTLCPAPAPIGLGLLLIACAGIATLRRTQPVITATLSGMAGGAVLLLLLFDLEGSAEDCLPILVPFCVFAASGAASLLQFPRPRREISALRLLMGAGVLALTLPALATRPQTATELDATAFLTQVDLPSFPANATIFCNWPESTALRAARLRSGRDDLRIVFFNSRGRRANLQLDVEPSDLDAGRPWLVTHPCELPGGWKLVEFRNLWRLAPLQNGNG